MCTEVLTWRVSVSISCNDFSASTRVLSQVDFNGVKVLGKNPGVEKFEFRGLDFLKVITLFICSALRGMVVS